MSKLISCALVVLVLASCSTERIYQTFGSPDPMGPSTRYPLEYPLCYSRPGGGMIIVPLGIRIYGASIPNPVQVMALRKNDPNADVCFTDLSKPPQPSIKMTDRYGGGFNGWSPLDMTGKGYFSSVSYMSQLLNSDEIRKEAEEEVRSIQSQGKNLINFGRAQKEVVLSDSVEEWNGLKWRHRLIARYITSDFDNPLSGDLTSWRDIYEHHIDSTHILRRIGRYDSVVVADSEWISARRELTRKIVEAVRIEKLTQAELDAAVADYERRRAIDSKCGSNERCRARESK